MNFSELCDAVAERTDFTKAASKLATRAVVDIISETLSQGIETRLDGIGSFNFSTKEGRTMHSFGKEIEVDDHIVMKFKAAPTLLQKVKDLPVPKKKGKGKR